MSKQVQETTQCLQIVPPLLLHLLLLLPRTNVLEIGPPQPISNQFCIDTQQERQSN